ncbi:MAG: GTPase RsgA, partial [Planctomycetes bacterium]|nr:GTPase RsgA [Planctomycetota bacterium]
MSKKKRKKLRVAFRKNRGKRTRANKLTREVLIEGLEADERKSGERLSGKGDLTRFRTVIEVEGEDGETALRDIDESVCLTGRVVAAVGLKSLVESDAGVLFECTVRRVVRTLSRDSRNAVVTGDRVLFLPLDGEQGVIERVEPRSGTVSRWSQRHEHILVANVDRVVIVASAGDPPLKTNLIDRFLISAERGGVRPIICINKIDLVDAGEIQPIVGLYSRIGYDVVLTSAMPPQCDSDNNETGTVRRPGTASAIAGMGIARLRSLLRGHESVFAGQSGVGKSTLLNALQPGFGLETGEVSDWTRKGKHTTRRAILLKFDFGGWVVDTPGIRQVRLWDVHPEEVEGEFIEFRP